MHGSMAGVQGEACVNVEFLSRDSLSHASSEREIHA